MDELYDLRISLMLGNYTQVINQSANKVLRTATPASLWAKDFLLYRAQVALHQYDALLAEMAKVKPSSTAAISNTNTNSVIIDAAEAVIHWVEYMKAKENNQPQARTLSLEKLEKLCNAHQKKVDEQHDLAACVSHVISIRLCLVFLYIQEKLYPQALTLLNLMLSEFPSANAMCSSSTTAASQQQQQQQGSVLPALLELKWLQIDTLLRMHRIDLAQTTLEEMVKIDDDSIFTMIAMVVVYMHQGSVNGVAVSSSTSSRGGGLTSNSNAAVDRLAEAMQIIGDLQAKYGTNVFLYTLLGGIYFLQGQYTQCEKAYLDALEKRPTDVDALTGLCKVSIYLGKPNDLVTRYVTQLKTTVPPPLWIQQYTLMEQHFVTAIQV